MSRVGSEYKAWIDEFIRMSQLTFVPDDEGERYQYWMGKPFPRGLEKAGIAR